MIVRDLAKKLNISEDLILSTLKSLKLRAKDSDQDLSAGVISVIKGELEEKGLIAKAEPPKKVVRKAAPKKKVEAVSQKKVEPVKEVEVIVPEKKVEPAKEVEAIVSEKKVLPEGIKTSEPIEIRPVLAKKPEIKKTEVRKIEPVPVIVVPAKPVNVPRIVSRPEPKPEPIKPAPQGVSPNVPNEMEQFAQIQPDGTTKTFVKKFVTKIVVKKVEPKIQPEFVSVKPLAHGKRRSETGHHQHVDEHSEPDADLSKTDAVPPPSRHDGPKKDVELKVPITVGDFAFQIQEKTNVVLKTLMGMGLFANINQNLGEDVVQKLCDEFHCNLILVKSDEEQLIFEHEKTQDDPATLKPRAPVVTFMGHVDHGKTSLLDRIRKTKVVDSEHGGITQHIAAYSVPMPKGSITFLDTPGHAAFTAMRSRGAHITDLVVVVIAADEGVMPQTEEAFAHARAAKVPIIVALNKMDRPNADADKVKKQLAEHDLLPEDWGGKVVVVPVSAHTGLGIDTLLEMILLEAEIQELRANPDKKAAGIVVEAHLSPGKGAVATMIVQSGTLKEGDIVVVGPNYGRVKAMFDDHLKHVKEAGPCKPVEILGLPGVPDAGEKFFVVEDERKAKEITSIRQEKQKADRLRSTSKITLEDLLAQKKIGEVGELNLVVKADVQGSAGALREALLKIPADNKEVAIKFIHVGVGDVNVSDVILAYASKAIVIAFSVGVNADANVELQKTPVDVRRYNIIYDVVDDIRSALEGLLRPDEKRIFLARAEVLQVFKLSKAGIVAGCMVKKGKFRRNVEAEVFRDGIIVHKSKLSALKRFKDDVKEVGEDFECGISIEGFDGYQVGDVIEAFSIERTARKL